MKSAFLLLLLSVFTCGLLVAQEKTIPQKVRRVKRVKRPVFNQPTGLLSDQKGESIYFGDVYAEAIVGQRPDVASLAASAQGKPDAVGKEVGSSGDSGLWSELVDAAAIEDEVKAQQQRVSQLVTSPVVFQTKFADVKQSFEILSVLFAVVRQYEGDVRWSEHAPAAQMLFQKAAVSARSGAAAGFRYCNTRKQDLQDLVRGGSIVSSDPAPTSIDWSEAAHRSPLMTRLETANENLKKLTANENEFKRSVGQVNHEANMIAMMARVILLAGMPEAEEDDYVAFGHQMRDAAVELKSATKLSDFDRASKATNLIDQSCNNCHADWR